MTENVMYDIGGRRLLRFALDRKTLNQRVGLMMNRADLHRTLCGALKNEVELRMGQEIAALNPTGSGVAVTFANGRQEEFAAVVGADGVHSNTRMLAFGGGFEKPMGYAYFAFVTANAKAFSRLRDNELKIVRGDGFTIAYHRLQNAEIGSYVFHREKDDPEQLPPERRRDSLQRTYGQYDATFRMILEGMGNNEYIFHDGFTQVVMPAWYRDRVCVIGDAAFCPTPASGVGASMAMAAAYIVAKRVSGAQDYTQAFAEYDTYMRPYIKRAQSSAARMQLLAAGGSLVSYEFTNFLLRLIPGGLVGRLHSHAIGMPLP